MLILCRIFKDNENHVAVKYKNWTMDTEWMPSLDEEPLEIFRLDENTALQVIPDGTPELVTPEYEKKNDMTTISSNIEKNQQFLTARELWWWRDFLKSPQSVENKVPQWYIKNFRPQEQHIVEPVENETTSPLALVMDKERQNVKVLRLLHIYATGLRYGTKVSPTIPPRCISAEGTGAKFPTRKRKYTYHYPDHLNLTAPCQYYAHFS